MCSVVEVPVTIAAARSSHQILTSRFSDRSCNTWIVGISRKSRPTVGSLDTQGIIPRLAFSIPSGIRISPCSRVRMAAILTYLRVPPFPVEFRFAEASMQSCVFIPGIDHPAQSRTRERLFGGVPGYRQKANINALNTALVETTRRCLVQGGTSVA